ncbi:MAG: sugar phosphate nucleotidyltransferase [Acidobacteriota bacterium]
MAPPKPTLPTLPPEHRAPPRVILLAGGEGRRLRALTRDANGLAVPKQFCDFGSGRSLLSRALDRARSLSPPERIIAAVASAHERWWSRELHELPPSNVVAQPVNRGTAAGLLLPLLHPHGNEADDVVVMLPCDHHVEREDRFADGLRRAVAAASEDAETVFLLGLTPDGPAADYGWIVPGEQVGPGIRRVEAFIEKPSPEQSAALWRRGGRWSSFVLVARRSALIELYRLAVPELVSVLEQALSGHAALSGTALARHLEADFLLLPPGDLSRDVLEPSRQRLAMIDVPPCGWSDLGTPDRLERWRAAGYRIPVTSEASSSRARLLTAGS